MSKRTEQVASEIQIIVSQLIQFELKDPRVAFCTVMGVDMSPDLQMAQPKPKAFKMPEKFPDAPWKKAKSAGETRVPPPPPPPPRQDQSSPPSP